MGVSTFPTLLLFIASFHFLYLSYSSADTWGGLYPRESSTREVRNLEGMWNFRIAPLHEPDLGFNESWFAQPLRLTGPTIKMPVPSSYNDITQDKSIRDHIGWAWYDRIFHIPIRWREDSQRVVLRVGSAHYNSIMYVNGIAVATHEGGHLPIMVDITDNVLYGYVNLLTICINNTLTSHTLPQGSISFKTDEGRYPPGYFVQNYNFDFFNFDGLHRPVFIYTTPQTYIEDIYVVPQVEGTTGIINYEVTVNSSAGSTYNVTCSVDVYDDNFTLVTIARGCVGQITIENANLWWPYLMSDNPGYQYTLNFVLSDGQEDIDVYPQKVGIRQIGWDSTTVTINGKPLYLKGCGKHEDADIRGKGVDDALIVKDFSLLKWLGANSFRTSHYPYAEEIMDMADEEGIMVIDESPAVALYGFGKDLLALHISVMTEFFRRDKNRPSVIMWSVLNEPRISTLADNYFNQLVNATKTLDPYRPVTGASNLDLKDEQAAVYLDVILLNRYFGWYTDTGHLEVITRQLMTNITAWNATYNKPIMISEYGASSLVGIHMDPPFAWSEEYQIGLMQENFKAFDQLKDMGFFFGEMIWNFADFATQQDTKRAVGNTKGIFTRNRQPKMSAHLLRSRYHQLSNQTLSGASSVSYNFLQDIFY